MWWTATHRRRDNILRRLVGRLVGGAKEWIVTECMPGALGRVWRSGAALCRSMSTRRSLCRCVSGWGARDLRLQPRYPSFWATWSRPCAMCRVVLSHCSCDCPMPALSVPRCALVAGRRGLPFVMQGIPRPCAVCRVPCCLEPLCEAMIMAPWLVPEVSVAEMLELNTFGPGGWHLSR